MVKKGGEIWGEGPCASKGGRNVQPWKGENWAKEMLKLGLSGDGEPRRIWVPLSRRERGWGGKAKLREKYDRGN